MNKNQRIDDGRFGQLLRGLRKIQLRLSREEDTAEMVESLQMAELWLREYVEPWQCPDCGWFAKIPEFDSDPRRCPTCSGQSVFPYGYMECERMNRQLALLAQCATHYARKKEGQVAQRTLEQITRVKLDGSYRVPQGVGVPAAKGTKCGGQKKPQRFKFRKLKFWG